MEHPRILVCGGRDHSDYKLIRDSLYDILFDKEWDDEDEVPNVIIIHGGAETGADKWADRWAVHNGLTIEEYKADWEKYGRRAGPIRNQQMLDEGKPDLVVAFPTPTSVGTWGMVRRAQKNKIETIIIGPFAENSI